MKRKYIWTALIAALTISTLVWYGCTEKEEDILGSIYGTVTDYATGEPVGNVSIKLRPSGEATLTGNDGSYEFKGNVIILLYGRMAASVSLTVFGRKTARQYSLFRA